MTDIKKVQVLWIFRKPAPHFFSIEKVFSTIKPLFDQVKIREWFALTRSAGPSAIYKNLRHLKKESADLYHITGDIHYAAIVLPRKKTILTIHDCIFLQNPNVLKRTFLTWLWLKWPVKRVAAITTISENSRQDIINHSGCHPDLVRVIPDPIDPEFTYTEKVFSADYPVLLQVGTKSNKNLPRVIEAIRGIKCKLDIIGPLSEEHQRLLNENKIDYSNESQISRERLIEHYRQCDMLVFASLFEGFGLPVIEAQAIGRPVLSSRLEPMKSVAGDAAYLADPLSVSSIREGILKLINDPAYRNDMVQKGLKNVQRFRPDFIAGEYQALYMNILANARH